MPIYMEPILVTQGSNFATTDGQNGNILNNKEREARVRTQASSSRIVAETVILGEFFPKSFLFLHVNIIPRKLQSYT